VSGLCSNPTAHGVLWEDGTLTDLGSLGGLLNTFPWAINSTGLVVGQSDLAGDTTEHAFVWTKKSGIKDLGTLPGDSASLAFGTNEYGAVVGGSCVDISLNDCRAFLWQNGVMIDVNSLVRAGSTPLHLFFGNDINARGEIAAYAFDQSNGEFHAAVAIPCDDANAHVVACAGSATEAPVDKHVSAVLPANLRRMLHRRMLFPRL
jgi:probable HAF family extracellular repeat protein